MEKNTNNKLTLEDTFYDYISNAAKRVFKPTPTKPVAKPVTKPVINPTTAVKPPLAPQPKKLGMPLNNLSPFKKSTGGRFAEFDLNSPQGYNGYSQICQAFINQRNPNAGITGSMMASSAKKTFQATGKYVPPELALAQLAMEGGLSTNPNAIPVRTNNPYNIGNWDSGRRTPFTNKQMGIDRYYDTMARDYLTGNRTAEDILQNFTNLQGKRYASAENYEQLLNKIVNSINRMKQSMSTA